MDWLVILLVVIVAGNIATVYLLWQRGQKKDEGTTDQGFLLLQNQLQDLTRTLDSRVAESSKQVHETVRVQLGESAKLIKEVTRASPSSTRPTARSSLLPTSFKACRIFLKTPNSAEF